MRTTRLIAAAFLAGCAPATDLSHLTGAGTQAGPPAGPGGAALVDPPAGAAQVPVNLNGVIVRFPAEIAWGSSGLSLCGDGLAVPTSPPAPTDCADGGSGVCYRVDLQGGLPPNAACSVALAPGAVDAGGAPLAPGVIGVFQDAAAPDLTPPVIGDVAVQVSGPCLQVAFSTDEPAAGTVALQSDGAEVDTPAGAGQTTFQVAIPLRGLPPSVAATVSVNAVDLAGNLASSAPFAFTTPPAVPPLAITEVLANPAGPEPQQEYVELRNLGDDPVSLAGLRLADSKGGDDLPDQTLAAGGYALVVTSSYDPAEGSDPPPRAGTLLARVDSRLGADGLSNSGEAVQLLLGDTVVSSYGGWVSVSAGSWNGKAVHRLVQSACDGAAAWSHSPLPPTPGDGPP
jgi:Lamin Tail Domain